MYSYEDRMTAIGLCIRYDRSSATVIRELGHESIETTHQYMEADLRTKERAMAFLEAPTTKAMRYRAKDGLLAFLDDL